MDLTGGRRNRDATPAFFPAAGRRRETAPRWSLFSRLVLVLMLTSLAGPPLMAGSALPSIELARREGRIVEPPRGADHAPAFPGPEEPHFGCKGGGHGLDGFPSAGEGNSHRDDDPRYLLYDLHHVRLRLRFDIAQQSLSGSAEFHLQASKPEITEVLLDLVDNLQILSVTREGEAIDYLHADRQLHVFLEPALAFEETTQVVVQYEGIPLWDGFLGLQFQTHQDQPLISSLSETNSAPAWWPCKDVPYDKFTLEAFFTVPDSIVATSNGVLLAVLDEGGGFHTFHWYEAYPITTYLVSVAATNYVSWSDSYLPLDGGTPMPVDYFAYPESEAAARQAWSRTPEMLTCFARRFGEYPFVREKYGMAEFNWGGAMEHQTLSSYGTYLLGFDQHSNERVVAHELAHQWWGDLVSPVTWDDIWLNEGFATYCEALWFEYADGPAAYREHMRTKYREVFDGAVYRPTYTFNGTVYHKGAWVLHMLRRLVGEEAFFRLLREYRQNRAFGAADTEQFRRIAEQYSGQDLAPFFDSWVYGTGMPNYELVWTAQEIEGSSTLDAGVQVDLALRQIQPEPLFAMPVELVFQFQDGTPETLTVTNSSRDETYAFLLGQTPTKILLDPDEWILKKVSLNVGPTDAPFDDTSAGGADRWGLSPAWPNPSSGPVQLTLCPPGSPPGTHSSPPALWIADVSGRVVWQEKPSHPADGCFTLLWDGRTVRGERAPSGSYWIGGSGPGAPRPIQILRVP